MRFYGSIIATFVITTLFFYFLAVTNIQRIDTSKIVNKPTNFYKLFKPKLNKMVVKKVKKRKQKVAKDIGAEIEKSQNIEQKELIDIKDATNVAVILKQLISKYPEIPRIAGEECALVLEMIVNEEGGVDYSEITYSNNNKYNFEEKVCAASKNLRFKPVIVDGEAVKVKVVVPIDFILE
jgi:TonB family protein